MLHGEVLESQQEFGLIGQKQVHVGPREFYRHVRGFEIVIGGLLVLDFVRDLESAVVEGRQEKTVDLDADGSYRILALAHLFLAVLLLFRRFHRPGGFLCCLGVVKEQLLSHAHQITGQVV